MQQDEDEHDHDDQADGNVRGNEDAQVALLDGLELFRGKGCALGAAEGIQAGLDEVHGHEHAAEGADGVERLRKVEAPGGRLGRAHREDVGVCAGFKETESACKDEIRHQEGIVAAYLGSWQEQHDAYGIKSQSDEDAGLVTEATD